MSTKTILITGATDGIGLETARRLAKAGHSLLLHGRNPDKLAAVQTELAAASGRGPFEIYRADLSDLDAVAALASEVSGHHDHLDVLINNAGVFKTGNPVTTSGLDSRFVVNTLAPYLLTRRLLPLFDGAGRIVNLSSAAQSPVDPDALSGRVHLDDDFAVYAQSKLAITLWSRVMAGALGPDGPAVIAVNPGSLLGSKMVKDAFGVDGGDLAKGADILVRAALGEEFADASGRYFDNDAGRFASPHADALDDTKSARITAIVETLLADAGHPVV